MKQKLKTMLDIRQTTNEETRKAKSIACEIFFEEQAIPKELTPVPDELSPVWWGAFSENELIGTIAEYKENGKQHIGRLTVKKEFRGQRIATMLVTHVLSELFIREVDKVLLDAREATKRIILSLGGEVTGEKYPFFNSTCTPVRITREQFLKNS